MKKFICLLLCLVLVLSVGLTGCEESAITIDSYVFSVETEKLGTITLDFTSIVKKYYSENEIRSKATYNSFSTYANSIKDYLKYTNNISTAYPDEEYGFQMNDPKEGEEIAIMHTNMGDIYLRFFPEAAPKAVENFKTHSRNGYYNGLTFHRVIKDFMIQGGDPDGTGKGGNSIWGTAFEDEFDQKLMNIYGSIAMANSGTNTNGSQFFINQKKASANDDNKSDFDIVKMYTSYVEYYIYYIDMYNEYGYDLTEEFPTIVDFIENGMGGLTTLSYLVPDEVWELYDEVGGNAHLDGAWRASGGHTVFGQVFKGMDVVDSIASVATDSSNNKPTNDVIINSIEIVNYTK